MEFFRREALAANFAKNILEVSPTSASSSGLFLAAPRRTGKSTFLREDLRPALEKEGALVLYVDLWEDRNADPGETIVHMVRAALARHEGVVTRLARSAGMEKVTVGGMSFSLDRVGLGNGISLSAALAELSDEVKRPIALIIDEAQQAIVSEKGNDALFALKAARDELNSSRHFGLRIVATGSNRDKLAMLRAGRDQAFMGAPLIGFPPLGMDFVQWFCNRLDLGNTLDPVLAYEVFKRASFRPELLGAAADVVRFDFGLPPELLGTRFSEAIDEQIAESDREQLRVVHSLTPPQSTVLCVMAVRGEKFAPFEAATMEAYNAVLQATSPNVGTRIDVSGAQQALVALQEKALVWRAARGVYALEETGLATLMASAGMLDAVPA
nr:ATP-binding protein [uncultured Cupriavidus sp.]